MMLASRSIVASALFLGAMTAPALSQSRPYGDEGQYGAGDPYLLAPNNVTDYPAAEVRAVPGAKARRAIARAERHEAYNDVQRAFRKSEGDFLDSEAMNSALEEEKRAFMSYELARDKALRSLEQDEKYQAQRALQKQLTTRIAERRYDGGEKSAPTEMVALASAKLDYAKAARQKEAELLARSTDVTEARGRLLSARARVRELQDEWRDEVRNDPELLAVRQRHVQAKIAHLAAEAYLEGVLEARNIALRYSYYLQRFNPYQVAYQPYYPYSTGGSLLTSYR